MSHNQIHKLRAPILHAQLLCGGSQVHKQISLQKGTSGQKEKTCLGWALWFQDLDPDPNLESNRIWSMRCSSTDFRTLSTILISQAHEMSKRLVWISMKVLQASFQRSISSSPEQMGPCTPVHDRIAIPTTVLNWLVVLCAGFDKIAYADSLAHKSNGYRNTTNWRPKETLFELEQWRNNFL